VGKAARRRREGPGERRPAPLHPDREDPRTRAEAALARLVRTNSPGRLSLAGAYAFGYGALGIAQHEGEGPDWYHDLDPLDTLFLGTSWPGQFRDVYEFGNARTAWLRLMRITGHWAGIERFVHEVVAASEAHELPVDEGELMLLAVGRLEDAGLDRRKLPAALLPRTALANARFLTGPDRDLALPPPPADAAERVAKFWASTNAELPHDGTAVDALREGLYMLGNAGLETRQDTIVLLPALYAALVARDDEELTEAGERAETWALGLPEDSPLVPIVDVMLIAARRDLDVDATLGHLFAVQTFDKPVSTSDRTFTADPGTALIELAFELGYRQVISRERKTMRLDEDANALLQAQIRGFEEKFGRPPGPDDPIFFDPDADEPRPIQLIDLKAKTTAMLEAAGISGAWIYAYQHTQGLLPRPDGTFNSEADRREWDEAIERYLRTHPDETLDQDEQLSRLRTALALMSLRGVSDDPALASSLVQRLTSGKDLDGEADVVAEYLHTSSKSLVARLQEKPIADTAVELARAWSGSALAQQVHAAATGDRADEASLPVLLAAAAAALEHRRLFASDEDDTFDVDLSLAPAEMCEQMVGGILESGDADIPRNFLESVLDLGGDENDTLMSLLVAHAVGYLVSMKESVVTPAQLDRAVTWIGEDFGVEYAGPASIVAGLAGHPESRRFLAKHLGIREVTVAQLAEFLDIDFLPAMIWLCTGMVATAGDGDVEWLRQHRIGTS